MNDDEPLPDGPPAKPGIFLAAIQAPLWFLLDWHYSRAWKDLAGGLPALLVGGAVLTILLIGWTTSKSTRASAYATAAITSLQQKDYAATELYFHRMALLDNEDPEAVYGMALAAAGRDDLDRARGLMRQIAPPAAAGYPPAHLWLAKDMLGHGLQLAPPESQVVEQHLLHALGETPRHYLHVLGESSESIEAHSLLGYVYWSRAGMERSAGQMVDSARDAKQAISHMEAAAKERPELMASLAVMYAGQKDDLAAKNAAFKARDYFAQKTEAEPAVIENRLQWGLTELLLRNYQQAATVLQAGLASPHPERFHDALAGVYITWYAATPASGEGLAKRMELLKSALDHGPGNPQVLTALAELSTQDNANAGAARAELERVLAQGKAPAIVHAILGTRALQKGDAARARMHLELANQGDPRMPVVLNNLAWLLATQEKPELEHALTLAESARKLSSDPQISATLGMILFRLGRHQEAVKELEIATAAFPDRAKVHEELATCYDKLGDPALARQHRKLAEGHKK